MTKAPLLKLASAICALVALAGVPAAAHASASSVRTLAQRGMATLMGYYKNDLIGTSWWQAAVAQSTLESYQRAIGSDQYEAQITATYNRYERRDPYGRANFENNYADDTAWWGLAWLQQYQRTGQTKYLSVAERDADYLHATFWDAKWCGGGVWWNTGRKVKNAIANALFLELTGWLADAIPPNSKSNDALRAKYRGWGQHEWSWLQGSGLIQGNLFANLELQKGRPCKKVANESYTYDQGSLIAGLAWLAQAGGGQALMTQAGRTADAAIARYTAGNAGILQDPGESNPSFNNVHAFKGIFVRDLLIYTQGAGTTKYASFLDAQATSIQAHDTTSDAHFGSVWRGPPTASLLGSASQGSAEAALVVALLPDG